MPSKLCHRCCTCGAVHSMHQTSPTYAWRQIGFETSDLPLTPGIGEGGHPGRLVTLTAGGKGPQFWDTTLDSFFQPRLQRGCLSLANHQPDRLTRRLARAVRCCRLCSWETGGEYRRARLRGPICSRSAVRKFPPRWPEVLTVSTNHDVGEGLLIQCCDQQALFFW